MKVGIQLYSIRDDMIADMEVTLKKVKEIGYDYVEFGGYYGGLTAPELLKLLSKYELECVSVHYGYQALVEKTDKSIEFLKALGTKYCVVPYMPRDVHKGSELFEKTVSNFTRVGQALLDNNIHLLYHNHDFEFDKFEGKCLLDWLFESVPANLLSTQIDTCWALYAGYDPAEYLKKYLGRAYGLHLKDFICAGISSDSIYDLIDSKENMNKLRNVGKEGIEFKPLGQGMQNIPQILDVARAAGTEFVIVEQDRSLGISVIESVKQSREYLRSLGI